LAPGYLHVEIASAQSSKHAGDPCGDFFRHDRSPLATTVICADGIGSGVKANVAAVMCVARLFELLECEFSLREAFAAVARTMTAAMGSDLPFVAFNVARIHADGRTTVLSYESPPPIFVGRRRAQVLNQRTLNLERAVVGEAQCHLETGEGLLICSDGITQAGLGAGLALGWEAAGVCQYVNDLLSDGVAVPALADEVHDRARRLWRRQAGDDCTAIVASCRPGRTVNILSGPPASREHDRAVIARFLRNDGVKVVCGATTAKIVGRYNGSVVQVEQTTSLIAPPAYRLQGIDLVTEGAVTLNQAYNILDEDPAGYEEQSGVTQLCELLRDADRVNIFLGKAPNPASGDISFRQQGILQRTSVMPLLAEKLRRRGKLVVLEEV
jgi:hypothetical protein